MKNILDIYLMNMSSNGVSKQPLSMVAYERIYRRIMTLAYEPGRRLEEKQLVEELDIGRTPIREALKRLAADFMVVAHPNTGMTVRPITLQNTRATFEALRILELGVADLAVQHDLSAILKDIDAANAQVRHAMDQMDLIELVDANSRFHHYYAKCSRNEYLINSLHTVRCETNRLAYLSYGHAVESSRTLQAHYASVIKEHETIIACLAARDVEKLKTTIRQHIRTFQRRIIQYMAA